MGALLFGLKFAGVLAGIAFLSWALNQLPVAEILTTSLPAWPAAMVEMANYFGVVTALQLVIVFVILRITIASIFAVARMF